MIQEKIKKLSSWLVDPKKHIDFTRNRIKDLERDEHLDWLKKHEWNTIIEHLDDSILKVEDSLKHLSDQSDLKDIESRIRWIAREVWQSGLESNYNYYSNEPFTD